MQSVVDVMFTHFPEERTENHSDRWTTGELMHMQRKSVVKLISLRYTFHLQKISAVQLIHKHADVKSVMGRNKR